MRKKPEQQIEAKEEPVKETVSGNPTFNPFIDTVNEKPYTQMNVNVQQQQMAGAIPEPVFMGNTIDSNENAYNMLSGEMGASPTGGNSGKSSSPFNPMMNDISEADKKLGAEHMAKLVVDGYEQLHVFANKGLQINERKLRKMVANGEIDLSVQIPYDYGKTITAGEFIQDFNEQNKDTLTVSKEFKKEVTPVLTRVLAKRGAGVTDEQYLAYLFGKDLLVKGVIFSQIRGTMTDMLGVIKEYTEAIKTGAEMPTGSQSTPPPPPTAAPTRPYSPEPDPIMPDYNSPDFNFATNETVVDAAVQKHAVPPSGKERLMAQKKRDKEIQDAMERAKKQSGAMARPSYQDAMSGKKTGKRGRKPKDYVKVVNEADIADAIILSETNSQTDIDKIEGLD